MNAKVVADYEELSLLAASTIEKAILAKPNLVLGLATGGTAEECYGKLVQMHRERGLDFSRVATFNLDEYVGLPPSHPQSYHYYMNDRLFSHVNAKPSSVHIPDGTARDLERACREYEEAIKDSGGIDLQILGIGRNGHIGFNEPQTPLDSRTHVVELTEDTRRANSRFFSSWEEVPRKAITMGVGTILEARRILLLASGAEKAEAVRAAMEGPVTPMVPASALQTHQGCQFLLDFDCQEPPRRGRPCT